MLKIGTQCYYDIYIYEKSLCFITGCLCQGYYTLDLDTDLDPIIVNHYFLVSASSLFPIYQIHLAVLATETELNDGADHPNNASHYPTS